LLGKRYNLRWGKDGAFS